MENNVRRRANKQRNEPRDSSSPKAIVRPKKSKKSSEAAQLKRSFICLVLCGIILFTFTVLYVDYIPWHLRHSAVDRLAKAFGHHEPVHAVILDAGSTGSRVLAFTFHRAYLDGHLILEKELFEHTKPGLSYYADKPEEGAASIASLIELAKQEIPEKYWSSTPLILKATAGLRLLPEEKADALLDAVRKMFKRTPFVTNEDSVAIMDGIDEGIFSWFTVNFLLERFNYAPKKTVAAFDLGGGSTQVTFYASSPEILAQKEYIHEAVTPAGILPVYTHSYLGLGLMAARKHVITLHQPEKSDVQSICVNPVVKNRKFHYSGVDYYVSGSEVNVETKVEKKSENFMEFEHPIVNFTVCSGDIIKYVKDIARPLSLDPTLKVFAFSYYFDRAADVGLIDETKGGLVQVKTFKRYAQDACETANADQPFLCIDLTFIWALLEKGFGLKPDTKIYLYKKINGHEISWALGAAHDILTH